jgi:hypothetical protein
MWKYSFLWTIILSFHSNGDNLRLAFWKNIGQYNFALAPAGFGIDTHRLVCIYLCMYVWYDFFVYDVIMYTNGTYWCLNIVPSLYRKEWPYMQIYVYIMIKAITMNINFVYIYEILCIYWYVYIMICLYDTCKYVFIHVSLRPYM